MEIAGDRSRPDKMPAMSPESAPPPGSRAAVVAAALLVGPQVAARATRDALFLPHSPVSALPLMTGVAAIVSLLGTLLFSRAMARLSPARLVPAAVAASGGLFLAEWVLALSVPRAAAVALFLHHAILGAVLLSGFWSLVGGPSDRSLAGRPMAAIGAGASLGGVAGGLFTWRAAAVASVPTMLLALAAMSAVALASLWPLIRGQRPAAAAPSAAEGGGSGL